MVWLLLAAASLIGGLGSALLIGAALVLGVPMRFLTSLIGLAVGTLLGAAFLGLLPEAAEISSVETALGGTLIALLGFFLLEAVLVLHHCHNQECKDLKAAPVMLLVGDAFHNAVDGATIGAAFIISIPLGVTTAVAVALHEIPQEVGDYAVLVEGGFGIRSAIFWNSLTALPSLPFALLAFWALSIVEAAEPYMLMVGAGAFIYIALADLVPTLHHIAGRTERAVRIGLVLAGVGLIWLLGIFL